MNWEMGSDPISCKKVKIEEPDQTGLSPDLKPGK
jgi:hypothetical protein